MFVPSASFCCAIFKHNPWFFLFTSSMRNCAILMLITVSIQAADDPYLLLSLFFLSSFRQTVSFDSERRPAFLCSMTSNLDLRGIILCFLGSKLESPRSVAAWRRFNVIRGPRSNPACSSFAAFFRDKNTTQYRWERFLLQHDVDPAAADGRQGGDHRGGRPHAPLPLLQHRRARCPGGQCCCCRDLGMVDMLVVRRGQEIVKNFGKIVFSFLWNYWCIWVTC